MTSKPRPPTSSLQSISSAEGSHVKTSHDKTQAKLAYPGGSPACGHTMSDSFAAYDPALSSWRMLQTSVLGDSEPFSETWPRAGMTQSGIAYRLRPSVPRTSVTASSLLPTPTCNHLNSGGIPSH